MKELPGGDLLAGINMDTAGAAVARLDAAGNFIWLKSYFRPKGMVTDALIEDDDSFIITGYTDSIASTDFLSPLPSTYHPRLFMMKLNGDGEVQWSKGYDSDPYRWYTRNGTRIERHHDGNYIVLGNIGVPNYHVGYRPLLMKTDQNGDTLWTRSAGIENHAYDIINMTVSSDGGILYNGQSLSNSPSMYIFKADSLGYLPCHNRWHPVVVSDLFPTDSSFTLTSIDGATAYPAFVNEANHPALVVTDGCLAGMGWFQSRNSGFRVHPNPNTGRFTVEFADPLMAESYYSVYDALGKLLYQRPLPAGQDTTEVDLSRFGTGTYVIRFTDREGSCYERVVVE
ncbi:MAG: T9SS type A sorting domain-containing protein [Flavobacteriales bacterium]|nr:T9SS type A sorting domain-containing protein [Flavobacteriales bacterium]